MNREKITKIFSKKEFLFAQGSLQTHNFLSLLYLRFSWREQCSLKNKNWKWGLVIKICKIRKLLRFHPIKKKIKRKQLNLFPEIFLSKIFKILFPLLIVLKSIRGKKWITWRHFSNVENRNLQRRKKRILSVFFQRS